MCAECSQIAVTGGLNAAFMLVKCVFCHWFEPSCGSKHYPAHDRAGFFFSPPSLSRGEGTGRLVAMIQFVVGAAAGYVFGTKAGRKRYHQIVNTTQKVVNSPVTQQALRSTRKAIANSLDPDPRMREVKDLRKGRGRGKNVDTNEPQIYEPDED